MTNATGTNLCLDRTDSRAVMEEIMNLMRKEKEEDEDLSKDQHSGASYLGRQGLGQTQRERA